MQHLDGSRSTETKAADYDPDRFEEPEADGEDAAAGADAPAHERRRQVVGAGQHGERLDKVLAALAPEFSRAHLQSLVRGGHLRLDGEPCSHNARRVRAGERLELELVPTAEALAFRPEPMALAIVHEDRDVLVLDKPAGRVVHPAAGNWSGTLLNGLLAHHAGAAQLPRAGIVHRLDKDTSGLMVVGKTLASVAALVRAIAAREVRREYRALAWGRVAPEAFSIEAPIGRDPASRLRMAVVAGGKPARTDVACVAVAGALPAAAPAQPQAARTEGAAVSALVCRLHTGRTHQIRVHLAQRGHPLVADALYGGRPGLGLERQALHAHRLAFAHPITGQPLAFEAAPPPDFAHAWSRVADGLAATRA